MYMKTYDVFDDIQGIGVTAVHASVISTESEYGRLTIRAHELIQKQVKESYCPQVSPTVGLPISTPNYDRIGSLIRTAPLHSAILKRFLRLFENVYYITRTSQHWQDTRVKNVCMP